MGRVVNNVCSMLVTAPAVAIISSQNVLAAVGAALVMFVGIAITLLGQLGQRDDAAVMQDGLPLATDDLGGDLAPTCSDPEPVEAAELTSDERLDAFVATFGLTERERDILEVLVVSDQSVQDIASTLFLRAPRSIVTFPQSTRRPIPPRVWPLSTSSGPGRPRTSV